MTDIAQTFGVALAAALVATLVTTTTADPQGGVPVGTPIPEAPLGTLVADVLEHDNFVAHQLAFTRVAGARAATDDRLRAMFQEKGLDYPAGEIFIRVFKHERILEVWARSDRDAEFTLVQDYAVCALPGQLGPKQRMGDVQVPEGFYYIDEFNPRSTYHLSLRVNYPNLADRMRGQVLALGGDIYIHGGCETIGCVPIEDDNIRELYWIAAQARGAGQNIIPVHIFPARLDPKRLQWLEDTFRPEAELLEFWHNLAEGFAFFEETRRVPWVTVTEDGRYAVPDLPAALADDGPLPADTVARPAEEDAVEPAGEAAEAPPGGRR